jgi:undecaprenyl-diphosphatase
MNLIEVIILALTQAVTEFVPVSSSGHLIAIQETGGFEGSLGLDVMLHFGTLLALVVYFWSDLVNIIKNLFSQGSNNLLIRLVISTIPAIVIGFIFEDVFTDDVRNIGVVTLMLFVVGLIMIVSDRVFSASKMHESEMTKTEALFIGFGQALALIPGTSRSGITMIAARSQGFSNKASAHYAFLMGIPVIFGATVRVLTKSETQSYISDNMLNTFIGVAISAIVGWFVLRLLLPFVAKRGLAIFGWYRLALASLLFIIWLNN